MIRWGPFARERLRPVVPGAARRGTGVVRRVLDGDEVGGSVSGSGSGGESIFAAGGFHKRLSASMMVMGASVAPREKPASPSTTRGCCVAVGIDFAYADDDIPF